MFKQTSSKAIAAVVESDDDERELKQKSKTQGAEFDATLAEHRTQSTMKELGLNKARKKEEIYKGKNQMRVEMNLYHSGKPLDHLMDKVQKHLLTVDSDEDGTNQKKLNKTMRATSNRNKNAQDCNSIQTERL